jgi:hypothetical protein
VDAWALRSHQRAIAAIDEGRFAAEIVPLKVRTAAGAEIVFDTDEHPRRNTSVERLTGLKVLHPEIEGFSITVGNSSIKLQRDRLTDSSISPNDTVEVSMRKHMNGIVDGFPCDSRSSAPARSRAGQEERL